MQDRESPIPDRDAPLLVGRDSQLASVVATMQRAATGVWAGVLISGDAGIGKSRLLAAAVAKAEGLGFGVLEAECHELERSRPFGPLVDALGIGLSSPDPERAAVAGLLFGRREKTPAQRPEPAQQIGAAPQPAPEPGPPADVQYQVIEALVAVFERLAEVRPVLLAIDDLQWADRSTLLALYAMSRRLRPLPVALLAAARPTPRSRELERLVDALVLGGGTHLELGPLAGQEVDQLVGEMVGVVPGASLHQSVSAMQGNPLLVIELVRSLDVEGSLVVREGRAETTASAVPVSLHHIVLGRLVDLSPSTRSLLRVAAVLGSSFEVAHLALVTGRSTTGLLPELDEALRSGVLGQETQAGRAAGRRLAFRHDLIAEAVYQEMAPAVRAGIHLDVARVLARVGAAPTQVAEHFAAGAPIGDREAVRWLRDAARANMGRTPGMAADFLEGALQVAGPAATDRDELLFDLTAARFSSGQIIEAEAIAREVLDRDHDRAFDGAFRISLLNALYTQGRWAEAAVENAIALAQPDTARPLAALILAESVFGHFFGGDAPTAVRVGAEAIAEGEAVGDGSVIGTAASALSLVADLQGRSADAIALGTTAVAHAGVPLPTGQLFPCHVFLGAALLDADRLGDAEAVLREGRELSEARNQVFNLPFLQWFVTMLRFLAGDWDDALAEAEAGLATAEEIENYSAVTVAHAIVALIALHRNDLAATDAYLSRGAAQIAANGPQYRMDWLGWCQALLQEARGDRDGALTTLHFTWQGCAGAGVRAAFPLLGPDLARMAAAAGRRDLAETVAGEVGAAAETMGTAWTQAAALRCRALATGEADLALAAIELLASSRRVLEQARACEEAAALLTDRRSEAVLLLGRASGIYQDLRAELGMARVDRSLRALGMRPARRGKRPERPAVGWASLTPTERAVADEVGRGLSNRQVADRLFVSPRTVESHLSHVFAKVGLQTRTELALELSRQIADRS